MFAEGIKERKYGGLSEEYTFVPLAFETLGSMGPKTVQFMDRLKERLMEFVGDLQPFHYFMQRVSLSIVRNNVASVMVAMIDDDGFAVDEYE